MDSTFLQRSWESLLDSEFGQSWFFVPVGAWLLTISTYWIVGSLYLITDLTDHPRWLSRTRHQPRRHYSVSGNDFAPPLASIIANSLFNHIFVMLPGLCLMHWLSLALDHGIIVDRSLPSAWHVFMVSTPKVILGVEIGFYYTHRLLHLPYFYKRFHKVHHSFKAPIALSSVYSHPFEALISSTFGIMGVAFVLRLHAAEFFFGTWIGWLETCRSHSGYAFLNKNTHDLHHEVNMGNLGMTGLLDYIHGTRLQDYQLRQEKQQLSQHEERDTKKN